jgi:hypothetical protein
MIDPISAPEQMMYCTSRISGTLPEGTTYGTGYFFNIKSSSGFIPTLITNKHVIEKTIKIEIRVHTKSDPQKPPDGNQLIELPAANSGDWVLHENPNVDLCALPVAPFLSAIKPSVFIRPLDASLIPSTDALENLDAIEDVVMVGYPNGLWDETNNFPLIRRGITATHPAVDFDGQPITVLDIAAFPGSSGSPVFIFNKSGYSDKKGNVFVGQGRVILLGTLFAGPVMRTDGKIEIREIPTGTQAVPTINLMINLGYVIKSSELESLGQSLIKKYNIQP